MKSTWLIYWKRPLLILQSLLVVGIVSSVLWSFSFCVQVLCDDNLPFSPSVSVSASQKSQDFATSSKANRGFNLHERSKEQYQDGPTFLVGIPSTKNEVERRQVLRETSLSYYQDLDPQNQYNRICSLVDLLSGRVALRECQIAYVFFLGGNANGPTELVNPNATFPIVVEAPNELDEEDLIYLNIKENLEDGKSQTFFKYASLIVQEFPFDYVAKMDSDTLLFTPAFLDFASNQGLPQRPNNRLVYGGIPHDGNACDATIVDTHPCPMKLLGGMYMSGSFYWMSAGLARFIASDDVPRSDLTIRHEDVDIGNFIFSHPHADRIQVVNVTGSRIMIHRIVDGKWMFRHRATSLGHMLWAHSLNLGMYPGAFFKESRNVRKIWRQFQAYWISNRTLVLDDIFQLIDLPQASGKEFVRQNDYIYSKQDFDSSPIVLEEYKLIFFPVSGVGDSEWRQLLRRMMGYDDWQNQDRQFYGLRYLYDYNISQASMMMTSPDWTRAIFVRDPKLRLLSNFLDHVVKDEGEFFRWPCCRGQRSCMETAQHFPGFLKTIRDCDEPYWRPQASRMEPRYLRRLNFIGHYATMREDAERMLRALHAWDTFGRSGWGPNEDNTVFSKVAYLSEDVVRKYLPPDVQKQAQKFYKSEYDAKDILNLTRKLKMEPIE